LFCIQSETVLIGDVTSNLYTDYFHLYMTRLFYRQTAYITKGLVGV